MRVFVCTCKEEAGASEPRRLGDRVVLRRHDFLCSDEGRALVRQALKEDRLVVIAGCTSCKARKLFADLSEEADGGRVRFETIDSCRIQVLLEGGLGGRGEGDSGRLIVLGKDGDGCEMVLA